MNHTGICWLPQSPFKCFKIALISASPPAVPTASDMFTWPVGQFQWLSFGFSHQSMYLDQNTGHLYGPIVIWTWSRVLFVTWNLHTLVLTGFHGSSSDLMINIMTKIFPLPQYTFTLKNDCGALWERFERIFNKHASITGRSSLGKTLQQVGFRMANLETRWEVMISHCCDGIHQILIRREVLCWLSFYFISRNTLDY